MTWSIPKEERYSYSVQTLRSKLDVMMGGRAAEAIIFGPDQAPGGALPWTPWAPPEAP